MRRFKRIVRDLTLYGECPKCGMPGLHKMPRRVLVLKLESYVLDLRRERYESARHEYRWADPYSSERAFLENAREEYQAARRAAEAHWYLLQRECYSCDYEWAELIRMITDDREAEALRDRYPEGLVVAWH